MTIAGKYTGPQNTVHQSFLAKAKLMEIKKKGGEKKPNTFGTVKSDEKEIYCVY